MEKSKVFVGGLEFRSKAELERHCREIVSRRRDGEMLPASDAMFFIDLILRRHERPCEKILPGLEGEIAGIRVRHSSGHRHYGKSATNVNHTFVSYASGYEIDFSWKKCCSGFRPESVATQAMRRGVWEQVAEYKRLRFAFGSGSVTCDASGELLVWGDARVDHWPKTFAFLRDTFLELETIRLIDVKTESDPVCGVKMADDGMRGRWASFHDREKTLRLVSARVNETSWREEGALRNGI